MSLKSEIAALRAATESLRATKPAADAAQHTDASPDSGSHAQKTIDDLLKAAADTLKDIEADIETYPQLAALAAFGLGLCLGLALHPHRR